MSIPSLSTFTYIHLHASRVDTDAHTKVGTNNLRIRCQSAALSGISMLVATRPLCTHIKPPKCHCKRRIIAEYPKIQTEPSIPLQTTKLDDAHSGKQCQNKRGCRKTRRRDIAASRSTPTDSNKTSRVRYTTIYILPRTRHLSTGRLLQHFK
jgi:hypothetical protein